MVVDSGLTVADADTANLTGATVSIGTANSTERLAFTAGNGITGSYNNGTGVLTLTGTSSVANYQTALRSVTYQDTGDNPTAARTITFTVNDGAAASAPATKNITIAVQNDAPQVTTTAATTGYTEQDAPMVIDSGLTVADPDTQLDAGHRVDRRTESW